MVNPKSKVISIVLILSLLSASLLAACTSSGTAPTAMPAVSTQGPSTVEAEPVTVEFWFHEFAPEVAYVQELAEAYEAEHPNVKINVTYAPLADYTQKLSVAMSTGTGPDMYDIGTWFMSTYQSKKMMAPVQLETFGWNSLDDAKNAYLPGTLDGLIYDGKLVAIPIQMNSFSLFINNRIFEDAGLDPVADAPKTWDDLIAVAKEVQTTKDGAVDVSGFDFSANGANWHMFMFEPILHQYGGEILGADGKVTVNSEAGVKALSLMKRIVIDEGIGDPVRTNAAGSKDRYFETGKRAMWENGPFEPFGFGADEQIQQDGYSVAPLPQVEGGKEATLLYGFGWTVNPASSEAKQKVAWDFIRFAAKEPATWLTRCGFFQPLKGWTETAEAKEIPFLNVYVQDATRGQYLIVSPYYNEISQAITRAIDKVLLEKADPKEALDVAADEITKAMNQ
jgi:multiple sugar transport system substrate-binding protein